MKFFLNWLIILILNQILFYNSCFKFYCIKAALLHTGIIALFLTLFVILYEKVNLNNKEEIESNNSENINFKKTIENKTSYEYEIDSFAIKTPKTNNIHHQSFNDRTYHPNKQKQTKNINKIIYDTNFSNKYKNLYKNIPIYLESRGINSFYHFTDKRNLKSIIKNGGLYSWSTIKKKNINSIMSSDKLSRQLDTKKGLEDFIRLSFVKNHPMKYIVEKNKGLHLISLEIDISVACWESTLFSNMNATDNNVVIGNDLDFLKKLNYDIFKQEYITLDKQKKNSIKQRY